MKVTVNSIVSEEVAPVLRRVAAILEPMLSGVLTANDYGSVSQFILTIVSSADTLAENEEKCNRFRLFGRYKNPLGGFVRFCNLAVAIEPARLRDIDDERALHLVAEEARITARISPMSTTGFNGETFRGDLTAALDRIVEVAPRGKASLH